MSSDSGGAEATSCSGSLGTAITGGGGDTQFPNISALAVTDIGATSARITWTTDEAATSVLQYGTTGDYGVTKTDTSLSTSHSISFDGLSANTTYHYSVQSTDAAGNTGDSGENTFVTNAASSTTTTSTTGTVRTVTASLTPTPVPDRVGPRIKITTAFEKTYSEPPEIQGVARDGSGVAALEYSLDGGINFLPVDDVKNIGTASVPFTVVPYQTDDGNYSLVFRATDIKDNVSTSKSVSYVIDRLPPLFGATIVTFGSQVIEPTVSGIPLISTLEYVFTTSLIGGATSMKYSVENSRGEIADVIGQKNPDTGLWRALIHFDQSGDYTIFGTAVDGASNKTVNEISRVSVTSDGVVVDEMGHPVGSARVTIFVLDTDTQKFVEWDGRSYGQQNPQYTDQTGRYGFVLPSGTYYLRVGAYGYKTAVSTIFTVSRITSIVQQVQLVRSFGLQIGPWLIPFFDFSQTGLTISLPAPADSAKANDTKTKAHTAFPYFRFSFDGKQLTSLDLRGKPTVITLLNTWAPHTSSQLAILDSLASPNVNALVIVPQESAASVTTFMKRGGYTTRIVADPDGTLIEALGYHSSPMHIMINRKGSIQSTIIGLATKEKILDTIVE